MIKSSLCDQPRETISSPTEDVIRPHVAAEEEATRESIIGIAP